MSLQVWLPLNGDLRNQGLYGESIFTVNNATINNNGKIGKCYSFNGTNSYLIANFTPGTIVPNEMSFCCWVKLNAINKTHTLFSSRTAVGAGLSLFILSDNQLRFDNGNNNNTASNQTTFNYKFSANIWYHIAVIQTNTQKKLYINGILQQSINKASANLGNNTASKCTIGASGTSNNATANWLGGYLNDVRIYDHCLSDKEVEEIAKGLVLHYKLDDAGLANPNLITNFDTSFLTYDIGSTTLFTNQMNNGTQEIVSNIEGAQKCLHFHGAGGKDRAYKTLSLSNGKIYTISLDYYSPNNQPTAIHGELNGGNYSWTNCGNAAYSVNQGKWQRLIYTTPQLTSNATLYYFIHCVNGYDCYIKNIKIEEGSFASPWCDYKTDMIYDSSGYNNDGTIVGSLTAVADSARYSCSTKFTSGQYIRVNNKPAVCMPKDAITVNLWQYATSWANPISCTEGGGWNFENSNGIRFPVYISGVGYKVAQSSVTSTSTLNAWHMLTGTMDKDNIKIYYDGQEAGTIANGSSNGIGYANNYIFIGAEAQGDNIVPASSGYAGNISDVRIYATALTAMQVKELYNTSATIDNLGNAYARELVEI